MNLLTIDTTLNKMFITLGRFNSSEDFFDSNIVESDEEKYHSAYLSSTVIKLLKKHNMTMEDIDAIATNVGPGSFTGIRVGTTTVRVMAQGLDIPAIGVSSLKILSKLNDTDKPTLVIMDARKNKAYIGIFGSEHFAPCSMEVEEALELANSGKYFVVSDSRLLDKIDNAIAFEEQNFDFGKALYDIAKEKLDNEEDHHWAKLKPLYIQPPPISTPKR